MTVSNSNANSFLALPADIWWQIATITSLGTMLRVTETCRSLYNQVSLLLVQHAEPEQRRMGRTITPPFTVASVRLTVIDVITVWLNLNQQERREIRTNLRNQPLELYHSLNSASNALAVLCDGYASTRSAALYDLVSQGGLTWKTGLELVRRDWNQMDLFVRNMTLAKIALEEAIPLESALEIYLRMTEQALGDFHSTELRDLVFNTLMGRHSLSQEELQKKLDAARIQTLSIASSQMAMQCRDMNFQ